MDRDPQSGRSLGNRLMLVEILRARVVLVRHAKRFSRLDVCIEQL